MSNNFRDVIEYKGDCSFVGSRAVTGGLSYELIKLSVVLALSGYRQLSGAANGTDTSSEFGAKLAYDLLTKKLNLTHKGYSEVMKIFLPWNGFSGRFISEKDGYIGENKQLNQFAMQIAQNHYEAWDYSSDSVKSLMTRNVHQVLNDDLSSYVKFVIAYTSDGVKDGSLTTTKTGGTGQAIRIAKTYGIPVFNLGNIEDKKRLDNWVLSESEKIKNKFDIDIEQEIKTAIANYSPFKKEVIKSDYIELIKTSHDKIFVHGCNCFNVKGSGLAKSIFDSFPEAYEADNKTKKGDRKKLGTYSSAKVERNGNSSIIINAYTQYRYGRDNSLYADYEAIRKVFKKIKTDFPNKEIIIPKIGSGLANGCWISIANTINAEIRNKVTLVDNNLNFEYKPKKEIVQSELDL